MTTCRVTVIWSQCSYPTGDADAERNASPVKMYRKQIRRGHARADARLAMMHGVTLFICLAGGSFLVVKDKGHRCTCYSSLALLVHELLQIGCTHLNMGRGGEGRGVMLSQIQRYYSGGCDGWTCDRFVMPSTKQMASSTLDFPLPLSPVIALKRSSQPETTVRVA